MMKNACHPGELLEDSFGEDGFNISIAEAARRLGVGRVTLSRVVNTRAAVSPDLAVRLERAGLSTARFWLAVQAAYDLSQALKRKQPKINPFQMPGKKRPAERRNDGAPDAKTPKASSKETTSRKSESGGEQFPFSFHLYS